MDVVLVALSCVLAIAWLPLALRFNKGWQQRRNPVSLAICAATLLFAYTNGLFALALVGWTTWQFFAVAWHVFGVVVVVNFYVAFHWSDRRFANARREYTIPPMNTTSTPRRS